MGLRVFVRHCAGHKYSAHFFRLLTIALALAMAEDFLRPTPRSRKSLAKAGIEVPLMLFYNLGIAVSRRRQPCVVRVGQFKAATKYIAINLVFTWLLTQGRCIVIRVEAKIQHRFRPSPHPWGRRNSLFHFYDCDC